MNATIPLQCEDYGTAVLLDETIQTSITLGIGSHTSIQRDGDQFYVVISVPVDDLNLVVRQLNQHEMLW